MARRLLALAVGLAGCAGAQPGHDTAHGAGAAAAEFKPRAAFRAYAARVLQVPESEIDGGASDPASAAAGEHTRGGAWQYAMFHRDHADNPVRGWVTADGTVITPDQNLGVLFAEAGVWARPATRSASQLAELLAGDLVWSFGMANELVTLRAWGLGPPELALAADGSGALHFFSNDHGAGSRPLPAAQGDGLRGGGGAPPDVFWDNRVVLTADHAATLTQTEFTLARDR